jgi:energy-coupling factor transporter ATP-binding protein EcfA2
MFTTKTKFKTDLTGFYKSNASTNEFPICLHLSSLNEGAPCAFYVNEPFKSNILDFLLENASLVYNSVSGKIKSLLNNNRNFKAGTFIFKYKNVFVKIIVKEAELDEVPYFTNSKGELVSFGEPEDAQEKLRDLENKTYEMMIYYTSLNHDLPLRDFEPFVVDCNFSKIHLFIKNRYDEFVFEPIKLDLPDNINVGLNYGSKFVDVEKEIVKRLSENNKGLYMFHGPPGTGKSTFLKYLTTQVKKDFIYIPAIMVDSFINNPSNFASLLQKKNSILILEDAEKAIVKRLNDGIDSSSVTSLLNISDGILGDILKCPIVLTYNCPKQDIDDALRRKGRLQIDYEFGPLDIEDSKKLAKHLGFNKKQIEENITENMVIADIYNLLHKPEKSEKKKERVIGFGK